MNLAASGRLSGRGLALARAGWLGFFAVATLTFAAAVPARWAHLNQPPPTTLANLAALGLPAPVYATGLLALDLLFTGVFLVLGSIVFFRRSDDRMALLAALFLTAYGVGNQTITPVVEALRGVHPALNFLINSLTFTAWVSLGWFLYLFPSGRFAPAWMRWAAVGWFLFCIPYNYAAQGTSWHPMAWPPWLGYPILIAFWLTWLVSQVYRYRRVSGSVERQQTKLVVFGFVLIIGVVLVEIVTFVAFPDLFDPTWLFGVEPPTPLALATLTVWLAVVRVAFVSLPVAMAISILRYRLFDIDLLIRRALVYSLLTGALGLVYFGSVILLQSLFTAFGSRQSAVAIVGSTLAIAALFAPLRGRIQTFIDRRFYRNKYDAARTLAAFGAAARDETDLDQLAGRLVGVVDETVQPARVSLWLKPAAARQSGREG